MEPTAFGSHTFMSIFVRGLGLPLPHCQIISVFCWGLYSKDADMQSGGLTWSYPLQHKLHSELYNRGFPKLYLLNLPSVTSKILKLSYTTSILNKLKKSKLSISSLFMIRIVVIVFLL